MSNQPILFLDIDGVLNSAQYLMRNPGCFDKNNETNAFDPVACFRLEQVLVRTGALIVLSSTWRLMHRIEDVMWFLHKRGAPSSKIIGKTPSLSGYRGREIQVWLEKHPEIQKFAIVDDDSDMEPFMDRLVKTSWDSGLLDCHVEQLVKLLS